MRLLATTSLQSGNNATAITALLTTQGTQGTSITSLQTLTSTHTSNITALQTTQGTQGTSITGLQTTQGTQGTSITALQTTQGTQGTSITALQTTQGTQGTSITTLQTTQTAHTASIASLNTTSTSNTSAIATLLVSVSTLSTRGAEAPLPYYANDHAARAGGLAQYAMYRTGPTAFTMRQTADIQYMYNFDGGGALFAPTSLGDPTWTIERWALIPQLRQLTMVQIASLSTSVTFGLSGGGTFNCIAQGSSNWSGSLVNPPTNTWRQFGAQCSSSGLISYWILPTSGGSFQMGTLTTGSALTSALGNIQFTVGMNYTSD